MSKIETVLQNEKQLKFGCGAFGHDKKRCRTLFIDAADTISASSADNVGWNIRSRC